MSDNWPTAPLIRVVHGREYDEPVRDGLAARTGDDEYLLATGPRAGNSILRKVPSDDIDEWEEVAVVPTAALKRLRDERGRETSLYNLRVAIDDVLKSLPADEPSALDRAADLARDLNGPRIAPEDTTSRRLAILLEAISFAHASPSKETELTEIARTCADWLCVMNPGRVGLEDIETSAREIDIIPDDAEKRYLSLTYRFAQVATLIGEGGHGGQEITDLGAYALAWAAQIIEEDSDD